MQIKSFIFFSQIQPKGFLEMHMLNNTGQHVAVETNMIEIVGVIFFRAAPRN